MYSIEIKNIYIICTTTQISKTLCTFINNMHRVITNTFFIAMYLFYISLDINIMYSYM